VIDLAALPMEIDQTFLEEAEGCMTGALPITYRGKMHRIRMRWVCVLYLAILIALGGTLGAILGSQKQSAGNTTEYALRGFQNVVLVFRIRLLMINIAGHHFLIRQCQRPQLHPQHHCSHLSLARLQSPPLPRLLSPHLRFPNQVFFLMAVHASKTKHIRPHFSVISAPMAPGGTTTHCTVPTPR
jgi:hypothetical protein